MSYAEALQSHDCSFPICASIAALDIQFLHVARRYTGLRALDASRSVAKKHVPKRTSSTVAGVYSSQSHTSSCCECKNGKAGDLRLPQRYPLAWTALLSQFTTKSGQGPLPLNVYEEMNQSGIVSSSHMFVAALKACRRLRDLEITKRIHAALVNYGHESDVHVGTLLVDVYIKCGSLSNARCVFNKMLHRNVITWTTMIYGYAKMEEEETALQLYAQMQQENVLPNARTCAAALMACGSLISCKGRTRRCDSIFKKVCLKEVRTIHSDIVKGAFEPDVHLGTMLVNVYSKCGSMVESRAVFEKMTCRNVVSWNAMISAYAHMGNGEEALRLYAQMRQEGVVPNDRTYAIALQACGSLAAGYGGKDVEDALRRQQCLEQVKSIHSDVVNAKYESDVFVGNVLVEVYAKCGSLVDATQVLEKMQSRNVVSWTNTVLACVKMERSELALHFFRRMLQEGITPDARAFLGALKACSSLATREQGSEGLCKQQCVEQVKFIHALVVSSGCESDLFVGTMLVDAYAKCGSVQEATGVFEKMPRRDVISWNAMILGHAQMEHGEEALQLYARMQQESVTPNERTYLAVLKAYSSLITAHKRDNCLSDHTEREVLRAVRVVHAEMLKSRVAEVDVFAGNMLVHVYAKCGGLDDARHVFEMMQHRDVVSWNVMIMGYCEMDEGEQALALYRRMEQEAVQPNVLTYLGALKACGSIAALEKGKHIHTEILNAPETANHPALASGLIDMYCRCGSMLDAQQVFDTRPASRDIVTWTALIAGYARHGESDIVLALFQRLRLEGTQPNGVTFLSVLTACSHAGLVEKGLHYFDIMASVYGISPTLDHYTCIIDLLGRAGHLDRAMSTVNAMPFQPDCAVWQTVLAACQKWNDAELARYAFNCLLRLEQNTAAAYISMTTIYLAAKMWGEAKKVEAMRSGAIARKQPGKSWWTNVAGNSHAFLAGEPGHSEVEYVYQALMELQLKLKEGF